MFMIDFCGRFHYTVIKEEVNKMLTPERHQMILQLVKEQKVVKLQQLVENKSSESRRDLAQLEKQRLLKEFTVAAVLTGKGQEPTMVENHPKHSNKTTNCSMRLALWNKVIAFI